MAGLNMPGLYSTVASDFDQYVCAVCMEIFQSPTRISCGHEHVFCEDCLSALQPVNGQQLCPQCRNPFHPHLSVPANDVQILMKSAHATCRTCGIQMGVSKLRQHMDGCGDQALASTFHFQPIKATSQPVPQPGPNRSTFRCPYCAQANLDCRAMIEHCNTRHRHDASPVVCPICASMPWGDPSMLSSNFLQHLNTRHKFEYETFVDYGQDDDAMLRAAIEASLQQQ